MKTVLICLVVSLLLTALLCGCTPDKNKLKATISDGKEYPTVLMIKNLKSKGTLIPSVEKYKDMNLKLTDKPKKYSTTKT